MGEAYKIAALHGIESSAGRDDPKRARSLPKEVKK
jgi:hypothetical protein